MPLAKSKLPPGQDRVLRSVRRLKKKYQRPPSLREIAEDLSEHYSSHTGVKQVMDRLVRQGFMTAARVEVISGDITDEGRRALGEEVGD